MNNPSKIDDFIEDNELIMKGQRENTHDKQRRANGSRINCDIANRYFQYEEIVVVQKQTANSELVICDEKPNHRNFLRYTEIQSSNIQTTVCLGIEMLKRDTGSFSAWIDSESFPDCLLMRFDAKGGTHRNNFPDIPLKKQSVPTSHPHRFEKDGTFRAYPVEPEYAEHIDGLEFGFAYFCLKANIRARSGDLPIVEVVSGMQYAVFDTNDTDPNENINFA